MKERLRNLPKYKVSGKVLSVRGAVIEAKLPRVHIGDFCTVNGSVEAEVVGFKDGKTLLMAYSDTTGISLGSKVESKISGIRIGVSPDLLGTVIDPFGKPMNRDRVIPTDFVPLKGEPRNPMERERIKEPIDLGIRVINALLTVGRGQRLGIFAGAGVGKSTLLGMISRYTDADVNVVALIGERGREVREFIEDNLGEDGLKKSVVVVATSDMPPLAKIRAAFTACAIAEYYADSGKDVLLLFDSLTRLAMAQREIGLSTGEPPTSKGYTPSVFTLMAKFIERAGKFSTGSITGIYTVLVEGDDISLDPVADAAIGLLDGHIVLSREMANRRIFPAVDILRSISRLTPQVVDEETLKLQSIVMEVESIYRENSDVINLGLYKKGTSPGIDLAIEVHPHIEKFIKQDIEEKVDFHRSLEELHSLVEYIKVQGERHGYRWTNE